jgi:hypothetical protein
MSDESSAARSGAVCFAEGRLVAFSGSGGWNRTVMPAAAPTGAWSAGSRSGIGCAEPSAAFLPGFLAGVFLVVVFLAADFLAADFLAVLFLAVDFWGITCSGVVCSGTTWYGVVCAAAALFAAVFFVVVFGAAFAAAVYFIGFVVVFSAGCADVGPVGSGVPASDDGGVCAVGGPAGRLAVRRLRVTVATEAPAYASADG